MSSSSIASMIRSYVKDNAEEIKENYSGSVVGIDDIMSESESLLSGNVEEMLPESLADIEYSVSTERTGENTFNLYLEFNDVHRDSLNPSSGGIDSIIDLFRSGYTVKKKTPYGLWHGKYTRGRRERAPDKFIDNIMITTVKNIRDEFSNTQVGWYQNLS